MADGESGSGGLHFEEGSEVDDEEEETDSTTENIYDDDEEDEELGTISSSTDEGGPRESALAETEGTNTASSSESDGETATTEANTAATPTEPTLETPYIKDMKPRRSLSPSQLAQSLIIPDYRREDPPVPYSTWRHGTSTGRARTTIELNPDIDDLLSKVQTEFEARYDTNMHKADLREMALVYGLMHFDDVFAMAEEWGLNYDN